MTLISPLLRQGAPCLYGLLFLILGIWFGELELRADPVSNPPNLHAIPDDLALPPVINDAPAAGKRVWQVNPGFESWNLKHALYLPVDWKPAQRFPVIMEYPGNGGFQNKLGDKSTGRVEDCRMGYGLTGGRGFLWVSLPFVDPLKKSHALNWWGDADASAAYCRQTVRRVCAEFGGDPDNVFLAGFSRGAIAGNYIGLRDADTADLWRGMILHSHYDGVRPWGYAGDDAASAKIRLARFKGRPQFVSHEMSIDQTARFLQGSDIRATLAPLPFPNHSDAWVMKDLPLRKQARAWLQEVLREPLRATSP